MLVDVSCAYWDICLFNSSLVSLVLFCKFGEFNPIKPGGGLFVPAAYSFVDNFLHETVMGLKFYDFS